MQGRDEGGADFFEQDGVGDVVVTGGGAGGGAAPDEPKGARSVALAPHGGAAESAFDQAGELVVDAPAVGFGAAFEFEQDGAARVIVPEGFVPAGVLADLVEGDAAVPFAGIRFGVEGDAGDSEAHDARVEGVAEDVANGL